MALHHRVLLNAVAAVVILLSAEAAAAQQKFIVVASTTSTEQSGLFSHILPLFTKARGIIVRVVAQGTGQALKTGENGDADVVFVHDPVAAEAFVDAGHGADHRPVMYNDFVIVGPRSDPAKVKGYRNVVDAYKKIATAKVPFISRGDSSGTHAAELRLWKAAGLDVKVGGGSWYRETGSGMGATLNTASALNAYAFTDRATWLTFRNRGGLAILVEGDERLFNQYSIMLVNPHRHPQVKPAEGKAFIDWLTSPEGQAAIASYRIGGEQLFFPNYKKVTGG